MEEFVIEVEAGIGDPPYILLVKGTVLNPISMGRRGMWRIDASDVLDVHAYIYYDGLHVFFQSADLEWPIVVNGRTIGSSWTNAAIPCAIEMGRARLRVRPQHTELDSLSDQETRPREDAKRPFAPGSFSPSRDPERTREQPLHPPAQHARPIPAPPPRQAPAKLTLKQQWDLLTWPKKLAMVVLPLLLLYFVFAPRAEEDRPTRRAQAPAADARPPAPALPSAWTVTSAPAASVPTIPVSALPLASPSAAAASAPPAAPTQRTLERQAVDLVASGQYERAAFVYDQLARQYPDRPMYREAARILRARLDAGAP